MSKVSPPFSALSDTVSPGITLLAVYGRLRRDNKRLASHAQAFTDHPLPAILQNAEQCDVILNTDATVISIDGIPAAVQRLSLGAAILGMIVCAPLSAALALSARVQQETTSDLVEILVGDMVDCSILRYQEAKRLAELKDFFLATMSHEIRTPLNGILGMLRMIQETSLNDQQRDYLGVAQECSVQLLAIINDILDYSKMAAGKVVLETKDCYVRSLIESAIEVVALRARDKGLDITTYVDPGVPDYIRTDGKRIKQILINLLTNAIKFTKHGFVKVSVYIDPTAKILSVDDDVVLRIIIKDTGIGIDTCDYEKIFNTFHQIDNGSLQPSEGTGLGLAIVKKLVHLFPGTITVQSTVGVHTTFTVCLPVKSSQRPARDTCCRDLAGLVALIVDDKVHNRMVLGNLLLKWNMKPQNYGSAQEALMFLQSGYLFDIAFLDIRMPGMSGTELARKLKADFNFPIIALSSIGEDVGDPTVFDGILTKPVIGHKLEAVIRRVLGKKVQALQNSQPVAPSVGTVIPRMRVLVVEDSLHNQKVALAFLRKLGYLHVDTADDGDEGVAKGVATRYDIILMDLKLPGRDGFYVTKKIKQRWKSKVSVIAMTADVEEDCKKRCRRAGMDGFISKPVELEELEALLNVLERRKHAIPVLYPSRVRSVPPSGEQVQRSKNKTRCRGRRRSFDGRYLPFTLRKGTATGEHRDKAEEAAMCVSD